MPTVNEEKAATILKFSNPSLAYAELRLFLSYFLWEFDLTPVPKVEEWTKRCRVWVGWEKVPLPTPMSPRQREKAVIAVDT
jgi:hypothetical protein